MLAPSRFASLSPGRARLVLSLMVVLSLAGVAATAVFKPQPRPPAKAGQKAPDPEAYRQIVERVRGGESYYDAAGQVLKEMGFFTGSVFNWRLPTYAWVLSRFPDPASIQWTLAGLAVLALMLTYAGERRELPAIPAAVTPFLMVGVAKWIFDGDAYYAQEVWAAVLLILSVAAYGIELRGLAVAAGLIALAFRELVLPYCIIAMAIAFWKRRWWEAGAWLAGILCFAAFLAWHAAQVRQQSAYTAHAGSLLDWITFGGWPFVLSTVGMNGFLILMPQPVLALYLSIALVGLIGWAGERGLLLTVATLGYLTAFAVVGLPYNVYWGLMTAPLLCFGPVRAPRTLIDLWRAAQLTRREMPCSS